ncbi:ribosome maturation factor RimP [Arthrobacter sp. JSM 101049]|uniref:ribosome maturation factor RimP n=1 Tax=Arthrobacter sp. JSM 101049 TaxID=929097 RepID=UPI00356720FA
MSEQPASTPSEGQRLKEYLEPTVSEHHLLLEDVEIRSGADHRTVNVIVDLIEGTGNVDLDTLAEVSQAVSEAMDRAPAEPGPAYDLEVSSPGVGRPLTLPRHWRRNVGRLVKVNLIGEENITGRLTDADDEQVTVVPDIPVKKGMKPKQGEPRTIAYGNIRRGVVEVEFTRSGPLDNEAVEIDEAQEA